MSGFHPFVFLRDWLPKGLYARSIIIIIAPVVLLQAIVSYIFFERHWTMVTRRLTSAVASEIAFIIDTGQYRGEAESAAERRLVFSMNFKPGGTLPPPRTHAILERPVEERLQRELGDRTFWFDVVRNQEIVDIRVLVPDGVLYVEVPRGRVFATNWHIFLVWMAISSVLLLSIAIGFLRNQLRPIMRLAYAAESIGKGRELPSFKVSGAREVRVAAEAFLAMQARIHRYIEQRTEMLAGVSHDLRTPLTRMKLELALMRETPEIAELKKDIAEMEHMLADYLAFARGAGGEEVQFTDVSDLLKEICDDAKRRRPSLRLRMNGEIHARLRRQAFKRCIENLVENAIKYGGEVEVAALRDKETVEISVDDDGPGIPPERRDEAFRAFLRLDESRNPETGGVGLGLTIARDIARAHGGDVVLGDSPLGGLRAVVRLPL